MENRTQNQRAKVVLLKTEDIKELQKRLDYEMECCLKILRIKFYFATWITLNNVLLIKIMVFNRKRPGDVEKTRIIEYENIQLVEEEYLKKILI